MPRVVLTRNQCYGHKTKDIDAAVCMYTSPIWQTPCEHPRCDDCRITFNGHFRLSRIIARAAMIYSVGRYPGAVALEKELEKSWRRAYWYRHRADNHCAH